MIPYPHGKIIWIYLDAKSKGSGTFDDPFKDPKDAFNLIEAGRKDIIIQLPEKK